MRHRVKGRKLSRTSSHRKATMRALATALVKEHRIVTTIAKAKELRGFIEPLITRAKEDNHHNRSQVFSSLQDKYIVTALFDEIGPKCKDRPGGYTRIIKIGFRQGDGAEMAVIELVDYNDVQPEGKDAKKKRTRRAGKSNTPTTSSEPKAEINLEEPSAVEEESVKVEEVSTEPEEDAEKK
tara:strand:+ start:14085 stop:14630 length:546 start_codon:yes stop_codon:yes gene_type:complete